MKNGIKNRKFFYLLTIFVALIAVVSYSTSFAETLNIARHGHTATQLADGKILIVGGKDQSGSVVGESEIFDSGNFLTAATLTTPRTDHTATLLPDGKVLVTGGVNEQGRLSSTEIYYPLTNSFSLGPNMNSARSGHSATVLSNGNILIVGGGEGIAEIFDTAANSFSPLLSASLNEARSLHSAVLLNSGEVLIVGGLDSNGNAINSAEIFDGEDFVLLDSPIKSPRVKPTLNVLPDGKVQVIGGNNDGTMEMFDPEWGMFAAQAHVLNSSNTSEDVLSTKSRAAIIDNEIDGYSLTEMQGLNKALLAGGVDSAENILDSANIFNSSPASVTTDKIDYPPGEIVTITGTGWQSFETVYMSLYQESTNNIIPLSSTTDKNGAFTNTNFLTTVDDVGKSFMMTAVGQLSGLFAQTAFQDDVNVTAASGGTDIPADKAADGGASAAYTPLGDIKINELGTDKAAFGLNQSSVTLIFSAPTNWQFRPGFGSVTYSGGDITSASILVTSSTITVTYSTNSSGNKTDTLTISGIQVQAIIGISIPSAGEIYRTGGTAPAIPGITGTTNFGSLSQAAGTISKLAFTTQPGSATAGSAFGQQPVVKTQDQFGNNSNSGLPNSLDVTVTLSSGTGPLQGTTTLNIGRAGAGGKGTVTYTNLRIDVAGTDKQLTASASGLTSAVSNVFTVNNPVPTTISISLTSKTVGQSGFTMTVNGTNFVSGSIVRFAGSDRTTTFVNSTQLTATIPASDLTIAGTFNITVFNPTPGGDESNAQTFTVNPADTTTTITSDLPDPSVVGEAYTVNFTVTVNAPGSGTPTGNVTVSDGTDSCTGTVAAGTCSLTSTTAGAKTLTATYAGNSNFNTSSGTTSHTVNPSNTPPTINKDNASVTVNEGQTATNTGTWSDVDAGDTVTLSASVGTVIKSGTNAGGTWSWSFSTIDGPAQSQTVTITADDGNGGVSPTTFSLTVNNVAPTATFNAPALVNEGSSIDLSLTSPYDPSSADTAAGFTYAFDCGDGAGYGLFSSTSTASCPTTDNGTRNVKGKIKDKDNGESEYTASVTINNVAPNVSNNLASQSVQYSDPITDVTITATDVAADMPLSASTSWNKDGGSMQADLPNGLTLTSWGCTTSGGTGTCTWTLTGRALVAPGEYIIRVTVSDDDGGSNYTDITITVTKEDARAGYTGALFVSTESTSSLKATVTLSATVQDITATSEAAGDTDFGDIRNATVTFINRDTNTAIATVPVGLVNLSDTKTGTATYNWVTNIPSCSSPPCYTTVTIGVIVNNYYTRNDSADDTVVTIAQPGNNFITGGGYLINEASDGLYPGDDAKKTNFGFNVKYNKKGTNLQGNINVIIRSSTLPPLSVGCQTPGLHVYQIKGNVMTSLAVDNTITLYKHPFPTATFNGRASIQDITNPLVLCSIDGNATLQVTMTDNGEPGDFDTVGITVWNKNGGLWFSSNWSNASPPKTIEQTIGGSGGGNLSVR